MMCTPVVDFVERRPVRGVTGAIRSEDRLTHGLAPRYLFQRAPATNASTATPASVAIGCSFMDFSMNGLTCLATSCA
jgi:hypothetical protein